VLRVEIIDKTGRIGVFRQTISRPSSIRARWKVVIYMDESHFIRESWRVVIYMDEGHARDNVYLLMMCWI